MPFYNCHLFFPKRHISRYALMASWLCFFKKAYLKIGPFGKVWNDICPNLSLKWYNILYIATHGIKDGVILVAKMKTPRKGHMSTYALLALRGRLARCALHCLWRWQKIVSFYIPLWSSCQLNPWVYQDIS